jgi:GNAT superfamily N-acetyltransferase
MRAYELNEVSWWSNWAEAKWLDKNAYVLFSKDFGEYFFNRGGFLEITPESDGCIELMEREFETHGRKPHLFLQSDQLDSMLLTLAQRGYGITDQMAIMEAGDAPFRVNQELRIEPVGGEGLETWAEIYLDSFYGESSQIQTVVGVLRKLAETKDASLLLGTMKGKPAGITALFRTGRVCGTYCLATHRDWRGNHIASTMLDFCRRLAGEEGRRLILQTILSDSAEGFYLRLGFRRAYVKDLFVKDNGRTRK